MTAPKRSHCMMAALALAVSSMTVPALAQSRRDGDDRTVQELATEIEHRYSKDKILEMYLNEIYFGNGAWGIAQAARQYYDKNPEELTDAECAVLAGVPKNPGRYNPLGKADEVARRRRGRGRVATPPPWRPAGRSRARRKLGPRPPMDDSHRASRPCR